VSIGDLVKYTGPEFNGLDDQSIGVILAKSYPDASWDHPLQSLQIYWSSTSQVRWQGPKTLKRPI